MNLALAWRKLQRWFAGGRTVADLAAWLKVSRDELRTVPRDYRRFTIPKRSGGRREILAPNNRLKALQRRIHRRLLRGLRAHPAATGFEPGKSIVDNALPHAGQAVVVNVDIVAFFPSIRAARVHRLFRGCGWGRGASRLLTQLCTYEDALPQGAPTSPRLSNLINYFLDVELADLAAQFDARYTRYADDITFSLAAADSLTIRSLLWNVRQIAGRKGYTLHYRRKLSVRRAHQRQEVTGLVVNDGPRLPRSVRRWLRAVKHRFARQRADVFSLMRRRPTMTEQQLDGWMSLETMIRDRVEQPQQLAGMAEPSDGRP